MGNSGIVNNFGGEFSFDRERSGVKSSNPTRLDQSLAAMACMQESEALVERCFADGMNTRSTPRGDSAFRGSSEASW